VDGNRPLIDRAVLEAAAEHGLDFLDLDERRHTAPVIVPSEAYAELVLFEHPWLPASRVRVHPGAEEPDPAPRLFAETPPPRPRPRRAPRRRDALVITAGLCSAAAATAFTAVAAPASLPWAAG